MRDRFSAVRLVIPIISLIAVVRLFSVQILLHKSYSARAYDQYSDYTTLPAKRGEILASDGYPLASNQVSYLLYAEPKKLVDKDATVKTIVAVLPEKIRQIESERLTKLLGYTLTWDALEHNLSPTQKELIQSQKIDGLGFEEESVRFYPEGSLAAHILG